MAKVDLSSFKRQMAELKEELDDLPEAAHEEFVKNTPKRSGNARRRTQLRDTKIVADYAYSQELEAGSSRQAPDGMIKPTEEWIRREVDRRLKGI
jgi:hypothetical protein